MIFGDLDVENFYGSVENRVQSATMRMLQARVMKKIQAGSPRGTTSILRENVSDSL